MTTIKDVAQRTGVSVTTVSRALNDYDDVAEDTRSRIKHAAELLDYHPNKVARSLQGSRTNVIALVVPSLLHRAYDAFWLEFLGGMAARCADEGIDVLLSVSEAHDAPNPAFERLVRGRGVDGLILCDLRRHDARIGYMARHNLPFVAFGRTGGDQNYPFIDVDGDAGAYQGVEHLITLGHRRIGYLGVDPSFSFSHFRLQGYCRALEQSGCPRDPLLVREALSEANADGVVRAMLTLPQRPTAVFAAADFLGLAVLKAARDLGLNVPGDLSLTVFDDNIMVQHADPALTAVSQSNRRLGEEAASVLLERIHTPHLPPVQRLVEPSLIIRASTRAPRAS